jgi:hypothetical protein
MRMNVQDEKTPSAPSSKQIDYDDGTTRFAWVTDLLPNELAETTAALMERGIDTVKQTLEAAAPAR